MTTYQTMSVSLPTDLLKKIDFSPENYWELRPFFETGVQDLDRRLWNENSTQLFKGLKDLANSFDGKRVSHEFTVSRRAYLKCVFTAKEYGLSFYDLSFWCMAYGFSLQKS